MARFATLCSSSRGNSTFVGDASHAVLIDAGSNAKQLELAMQTMQLSVHSLCAIFITHEHTDHISALRVFASRYCLPVYATPGTYYCLMHSDCNNGKFPIYPMTESVVVDGISVTPFPTSHDAADSVGYRIELGERTVGICTDTGFVTQQASEALTGCDLVLLESNHDTEMLKTGSYSYVLKKRILSERGHLSNDACARIAVNLLQKNTRRFVLGHLSLENNTPELAYGCTRSAFDALGAKEKSDYTLCVAPEKGMNKYIVF